MLSLIISISISLVGYMILSQAENKINIICGWMFTLFVGALITLSICTITKDNIVNAEENTDTTYYQAAEIVDYSDTCVYFATPNNNVFCFEMGNVDYPDTVPYLLHMDNMGTDDVADDKILVVWRCAE